MPFPCCQGMGKGLKLLVSLSGFSALNVLRQPGNAIALNRPAQEA